MKERQEIVARYAAEKSSCLSCISIRWITSWEETDAFEKTEGGPMEVAVAACSECEAFWDADSFGIYDDVFYDFKYGEGDAGE